MSRIVIAVILAVIAAAGFVAYDLFLRAPPILTVTSWAGPYGRAQAAAEMRPYAEKTGTDVRIAEHDAGIGALRHAVTTHAYSGDAIDFELPDAVAACREGLLEKIDPGALGPGVNATPAAQDFVAGAVGPCWVGSVAYSQAIVAAPATGASHLADFFDLAKIPGRRGLRRGPKYNLEMALLADGVAPSAIYATLSTDAGLARAFAKLDGIRPVILWWSKPGEPIDMVAGGNAVFSTVLNGDIYDAAVHHGRPLRIIWDRQLYEFDVFAVPAGDPNKDLAMDFIRFATGSAPLAAVAGWVPYGPARRSALPLVGKNPELGIGMTPFLPTAPQNFKTAFAVDDSWWLAHGPAIEARWQAWLARRPS